MATAPPDLLGSPSSVGRSSLRSLHPPTYGLRKGGCFRFGDTVRCYATVRFAHTWLHTAHGFPYATAAALATPYGRGGAVSKCIRLYSGIVLVFICKLTFI